MEDKVLIEKAFEARERSYSPYSKFKVGAALLGKNGEIYLGCNIENAAYSPTNCAERTAFFKAVSDGQMDFEAIAIVGGPAETQKGEGDFCAPCGVCRQVMAEFCDPKTFRIILGKSETDYKVFLLEELLPLSFTKEDLK
ncbi:cytidine deaminase [Cellulosilyticum sp. I15G10I2]|uniref:cytidine deaminase n=1 Tax=Cellulosilyticum sp. I15G10I2 TaxID=1892843 RepID=UPI003FA40CB3